MDVAVISPDGKVVAIYPIFLAGLNYQPTQQEYFDEARRMAIDDKLVDSELAGKLQFRFVGDTFESNVRDRVESIFRQRFLRAPKTLLLQVLGETYVRQKLWIFDDHVLLYVGHPRSLRAAEQRRRRFGDPFPSLVSKNALAPATLRIPDGTRNVGIENLTLQAEGQGAAIFLGQDTSVFLRGVRIDWGSRPSAPHEPYDISLAYVVRFGQSISRNDYDEVLDEMVAYHLTRAAE